MSRALSGIAAFLVVCGVGALGYMAAGWSAVDAIYMVIITVFGVGYGEVNPVLSTELRSFTIGVIVAGYAAALYAVGGFVQMITEGEIHRALGARRVTAGIDSLTGHAIVCGFGRIGRILCTELRDARMDFVVVDSSELTIEDVVAVIVEHVRKLEK